MLPGIAAMLVEIINLFDDNVDIKLSITGSGIISSHVLSYAWNYRFIFATLFSLGNLFL